MEDPIHHLLALGLISVLLLCFSARFFLKAVAKPLPLPGVTPYSRMALRVERGYKAFAWGALVLTFLGVFLLSFVDLFARI